MSFVFLLVFKETYWSKKHPCYNYYWQPHHDIGRKLPSTSAPPARVVGLSSASATILDVCCTNCTLRFGFLQLEVRPHTDITTKAILTSETHPSRQTELDKWGFGGLIPSRSKPYTITATSDEHDSFKFIFIVDTAQTTKAAFVPQG